MTDISKCNGYDCPIRSMCYRHTAPSGEMQSWIGPVYDHIKRECDEQLVELRPLLQRAQGSERSEHVRP